MAQAAVDNSVDFVFIQIVKYLGEQLLAILFGLNSMEILLKQQTLGHFGEGVETSKTINEVVNCNYILQILNALGLILQTLFKVRSNSINKLHKACIFC